MGVSGTRASKRRCDVPDALEIAMPYTTFTRGALCRRCSILAATATVLLSGAMAASSFPPLRRELVLDEKLGGVSPQEVKGARIGFAPGQPTPRHLHPIPVVGVVTKGSFTFQIEGQAAKTIKTGEPFYEPADVRIARFDNASSDEPGEIVAFYLVDRPDRELIKLIDNN
jgi:quercetin dioxygenase-like cupin family protein